MNFTTFLSEAFSLSWWDDKRVICFVGKSYPVLFFSRLFTRLEGAGVLPAVMQPLMQAAVAPAEVMGTLSSSFLGQRMLYWLGRQPEQVSQAPRASQASKGYRQLQEFLRSYAGPHVVMHYVVTDHEVKTRAGQVVVEIPQELDEKQFMVLAKALGDEKKVRRHSELVSDIFFRSLKVSFETCVLLLDYLELLSVRNVAAMKSLLPKLVAPKTSLHALSKAFFEKKPKLFYSQWQQVYRDYNEMFWISFFSEQLWQAYHVVLLQREGKGAQAKRVGYRLPFSFFTSTWRKVRAKELVKAHDVLYRADYSLKRGSKFCVLDYFFGMYFDGCPK